MRISGWSSDVCSSDLCGRVHGAAGLGTVPAAIAGGGARHGRGGTGDVVAVAGLDDLAVVGARLAAAGGGRCRRGERKSVVQGKSVAVRVVRGGSRILNKTIKVTKPTKHTKTKK